MKRFFTLLYLAARNRWKYDTPIAGTIVFTHNYDDINKFRADISSQLLQAVGLELHDGPDNDLPPRWCLSCSQRAFADLVNDYGYSARLPQSKV